MGKGLVGSRVGCVGLGWRTLVEWSGVCEVRAEVINDGLNATIDETLKWAGGLKASGSRPYHKTVLLLSIYLCNSCCLLHTAIITDYLLSFSQIRFLLFPPRIRLLVHSEALGIPISTQTSPSWRPSTANKASRSVPKISCPSPWLANQDRIQREVHLLRKHAYESVYFMTSNSSIYALRHLRLRPDIQISTDSTQVQKSKLNPSRVVLRCQNPSPGCIKPVRPAKRHQPHLISVMWLYVFLSFNCFVRRLQLLHLCMSRCVIWLSLLNMSKFLVVVMSWKNDAVTSSFAHTGIMKPSSTFRWDLSFAGIQQPPRLSTHHNFIYWSTEENSSSKLKSWLHAWFGLSSSSPSDDRFHIKITRRCLRSPSSVAVRTTYWVSWLSLTDP